MNQVALGSVTRRGFLSEGGLWVLGKCWSHAEVTGTVWMCTGLRSRVDSVLSSGRPGGTEGFSKFKTPMAFLARVNCPALHKARPTAAHTCGSSSLSSRAGVTHAGQAALSAPEWLFPVHPLVLREGRPLAEGPATVGTVVGLLSSVGALVQGELRALAEGLAALPASVGPLPRVDPLVPCQLGTLAEAPSMLATLVRLLSRVDDSVLNERGAPTEGLPHSSHQKGLSPV